MTCVHDVQWLEHVTCVHDVQWAGTCDLKVVVDRFYIYIALFSALKQTRCACIWFYILSVSTDLFPRACAMSWSV